MPRIGRFLVLERIGSGGMGVVYSAYDPQLDRKVAIKLLQMELDDAELQLRLSREAKAMARLSHPNVAAVFEIGEYEGRPFVAMEFVTGATLRQWVREQPRSWREILQVYAQAGRGLAAAHEAGLVHRDFKPDNALIGEDGRVRVVDFGLARAEFSPSLRELERTGDPIEGVETPLTREGALLGTPAYMAPEAVRGVTADARSDQFAFCVSLWEALTGGRPFAGSRAHEVFDAALAGAVRPPPRGSMPTWIEASLRRGLTPDPRARHATMNDLLRALETDPALARRRKLALGVALAVGPAILVGLEVRALLRADACVDAAASIDEVWNPEVDATVRQALIDSGAGNGRTTADKAMPNLDAYAQRWREYAEQLCIERPDGGWSEDLADRSDACMEDARSAFANTIDLLAAADRDVVQRAVSSVAALPSVEACADERALLQKARPDDPDLQHEARAIERELVAVHPLNHTARNAEALRRAEAVLSEAKRLQWRPLVASARLAIATAALGASDFERAALEYELAFHDGVASGADETAASAAIGLAWVLGFHLERLADGERWAALAATLLERIGEPSAQLVNDRRIGLAYMSLVRGNFADAQTSFTAALEGLEDALGAEHEDIARALVGLSEAQVRGGRAEEARASSERAAEIVTNVLGADHPLMANVWTGLAWACQVRGEHGEAIEIHRRALALREAAYGEEHIDVANSLMNVADALSVIGEVDEARAHLERAIAIYEHRLGARHPQRASALGNLANLEYTAGRAAEARELARTALEIIEAVHGPDHPQTGRLSTILGNAEAALGNNASAREHLERGARITEVAHGAESIDMAYAANDLANVESALGEYERAAEHYAQSLAIAEAQLGPDDPFTSYPLTGLGTTSADLGDLPAARGWLERALAIRERTLPSDHPQLGYALVNLAKVLSRSGDRQRARSLLARAIALFEGHPGLGYALLEAGHNELADDVPRAALAHLERALVVTEAAVAAGGAGEGELAEVQFALAQLLVRTTGGRARALALGRAAAETFAIRGSAAQRAELDTWLERHGG